MILVLKMKRRSSRKFQGSTTNFLDSKRECWGFGTSTWTAPTHDSPGYRGTTRGDIANTHQRWTKEDNVSTPKREVPGLGWTDLRGSFSIVELHPSRLSSHGHTLLDNWSFSTQHHNRSNEGHPQESRQTKTQGLEATHNVDDCVQVNRQDSLHMFQPS